MGDPQTLQCILFFVLFSIVLFESTLQHFATLLPGRRLLQCSQSFKRERLMDDPAPKLSEYMQCPSVRPERGQQNIYICEIQVLDHHRYWDVRGPCK